jgi:DNA-directed RNA polymerase specialized sigma24 family protein
LGRFSVGENMQKKMTDLEIVKKIKKGRKDLIITLYKRYTPMMQHYANRVFGHFKIIPPIRQLKEDFIQDSYFKLLDAIRYCNISKIVKDKTKDQIVNWKFKFIFGYFLRKLVYEYYTVHYRGHKNTIDIDTLENYLVGDNGDSYYLPACKEAFYKKLTPNQRRCVKYREQGLSSKEIARKINYSKQWVAVLLLEAKKIASKEFQVDYVK